MEHNPTNYDLVIDGRSIVVYIIQNSSQKAILGWCEGHCGVKLEPDDDTVTTMKILRITADGFDEIELGSPIGLKVQAKLNKVKLNGKVLCEKCFLKLLMQLETALKT